VPPRALEHALVIVVLVFTAFVLLVGLLAWKPPRRIQIRSCCSTRPWPPDDLTDSQGERRG
jgi:hypothetical protein